MDPRQEITGVILAGGQSRRFGSNKALSLWRGKLLIQHVRDSLSSVFDDILLSTNSPDQYLFLKMPTVIDRFPDMGPLAGIHAALHRTSKQWIFVVGCDMPAITPYLISFISSYVHDDFEAVLPWLKTGPEPLCGLYHKTVLAKIEMQLADRKSQVKELIEKLSVRKVKESELQTIPGGVGLFININRTKDLENL